MIRKTINNNTFICFKKIVWITIFSITFFITPPGLQYITSTYLTIYQTEWEQSVLQGFPMNTSKGHSELDNSRCVVTSGELYNIYVFNIINRFANKLQNIKHISRFFRRKIQQNNKSDVTNTQKRDHSAHN